jgi:hypothetical protein
MLENLPDGIVAYVWVAFGGLVLIVVAVFIGWCYKNDQFNEEIKNQIFSEGDDDRFVEK